MRVLVAPDRFSGALTAPQAARALADGWAAAVPGDDVTVLPMSDGAAGLLEVVHAARGGRLSPLTLTGPLGARTPGAVLHVPGPAGGTAFVEGGQAIGPQLVTGPDAVRAARVGTSAGLGELLLAAAATGAGRIVVGLPLAVAVHDAGAGMLATLAGLPADHPLRGGGTTLGSLDPAVAADAGAAGAALNGADVVVAAADDAALLGLHGAGALLGQRPGIGPAVAQELERAVGAGVAVLEGVLRRPTTLPVLGATAAGRSGRAPGSGAGGGAAFALTALGARTLPGADVVAAEVGLEERVAVADLVVTGGGLLDVVAISRSVIATVGTAAMERGLPVVAVAEEIHTNRRELAAIGVSGAYEVVDRRIDGTPRLETPVLPREALAARAGRLARTWSA